MLYETTTLPVGLCSDHAGYELKNIIAGYLESKRLPHRRLRYLFNRQLRLSDYDIRVPKPWRAEKFSRR